MTRTYLEAIVYMYVCMYVVCIGMFVCMYVRMCWYLSVCTVCMYVCIGMYVYVLYICMYDQLISYHLLLDVPICCVLILRVISIRTRERSKNHVDCCVVQKQKV